MSSYVLDRDLLITSLTSGRNSQTNWIDANSNAALIGTNVYQRSTEADFRKQMADLQDQLNMLKTDVDKKDRLIAELSSYKDVQKIRSVETYSVEKQIVESTKRELTHVQSRYETVATELSETKLKVQAREERINEMKREMETMKNENATMNSLIVSLRNKIKELEGDLGGFETVTSKSSITINTLQKENKELQQKCLELESRIRTHLNEREDAERKMETLYNKLDELATQLTNITGTKISASAHGLEVIIKKINDIVNENSMLKGKLMTSSETLTSTEKENKANRETIQRLVKEINKFEKDVANSKVVEDNLKAERDVALSSKTVLEKEIETLKERLANIQTAWQATKGELEKKDGTYTSQAANLKQMEYDVLYNKNCLTAFRDQVSALLSDGFVKVESNEEQIKEKIKLLMTSSKDRGLMIASMEGKIQQLANQLSEQINLYKEMECKYQRNESLVIELENRLKSLDSEYCATEVLRDNLKSDRVKYLSFLERLGNVLKISQISADVGLDMNVDVLLGRAEQLVKMESDLIQDKQTNIYNLQRKLKSMKEQLDNKELHLDLLRKKLTSLEEEKAGKNALEREVEDHVMMSKKFKIKVEKLTEQLNSLKCENSELKAQIIDLSNVKSRTSDQEKEINKLIEKISDLESIKEKQSIKLAKLRSELDSTHEVSRTRASSTDTSIHALSIELRTLKQDFEKTQERERQLLDFRNVIARMLGLDVNTLAVADYEIIARMERVISAFNGGILPVQVHQVQAAQANNTQQNYEYHSSCSSMNTAASGATSPTRRHYHVHSHNASSQRERSVSPSRHHNHHHHHHNHNHNHDSSESSSIQVRARSKSPRKVTIDPNSY